MPVGRRHPHPGPPTPKPSLTLRAGGAEHLATACSSCCAEEPQHIFVAAGDLIGASPLLSALFRTSRPSVESLALMGLETRPRSATTSSTRAPPSCCDAERRLCRPTAAGPAPFEGAAVPVPRGQHHRRRTGKPLLPAYHVKRFQGMVAFIGLTLKETPTGARRRRRLSFRDEAETVNALVPS